MALTGSTNTAANTAIRYLTQNNMSATSSLAKLSSGSRIVKASDDAASLSVGTKIQADVSSLRQASNNSAQASSVLQVADGGMSQISNVLQRMKSLSVQASSGSISDTERSFLNTEYTQLREQIDQIAVSTQFNGQQLLNGTAGTAVNDSFTGSAINKGAGVSIDLTGQAATGEYTLAFDGTDTLTLTGPGGQASTIQFDAADYGNTLEGSFEFADAGVTVTMDGVDSTTAIAADNTFRVEGSGVAISNVATGIDGGDGVVLGLTQAGAATAGTYTLDYAFDGTDTGTFTLTDAAGRTFEAEITATGDFSGSVDLSEAGITLDLAGFDATTDITADNTFDIEQGSALRFQVGLNSTSDSISVNIDDVDTVSLGLAASDITTTGNAAAASNALDGAIEQINEARANVGAFISRFESLSANLATSIENLDAARSTLMDVDIAKEMTKFSSAQVLTQASTAMLAQANQLPQGLLRLLN